MPSPSLLKNFSSIILIISGPFQGKSLAAIKIADICLYSGIVSTDTLRNVLRQLDPTPILCESTSRLTDLQFQKQREAVSILTEKLMETYAKCGEKVIFEGIHFSKPLLRKALRHGANCFFIENQLPWMDRVRLKTLTNPSVRVINPKTLQTIYLPVSKVALEDNLYLKSESVFERIHNTLKKDCTSLGIKTLNFSNFETLVSFIRDTISK